MKLYQNPDGSFEDESGRPVDPRVADSNMNQAIATGIGISGRKGLENLVNMLPGDEMFKGSWSDKLLPDVSPEDYNYRNQMQEMWPKSTGAGEMLPGMVGLSSKKRALDMGLAGAEGALFGDPKEPALVRVAKAMAGNVGGDMSGRLIGKLGNWIAGAAKGAKTSVNPINRKMAGQVEDAGGSMTPYQKTGDERLGGIETMFESNPVTRGKAKAGEDINAEVFSKAIGEASGLPAADVAKMKRFDIDALRKAQKLNSAEFQRVSRNLPTDMEIPTDVADDLRKNVIKGDTKYTLDQMGIEIPDEGPIIADGPTLMTLRNSITDSIKPNSATNTRRAGKFRKDKLDAIAEAYADPDVSEQWRNARTKFGFLQNVDNVSGMKTEGGLTPKNLWNRLSKNKDSLTDDSIEAVKSIAQGMGSEATKIPYNYSRTGMSDWKNIPPGLLAAPLAKSYYGGDGASNITGLLDAAMTPAPEIARFLGRGAGTGLLLQEE